MAALSLKALIQFWCIVLCALTVVMGFFVQSIVHKAAHPSTQGCPSQYTRLPILA